MAFKSTEIHHLTFEGGGGKGIVYQGVIKALEEQLKAKPIINLYENNPLNKQIRGMSGASAGAITAFMLSIGMSSDEIGKATRETAKAKLASILNVANETVEISLFEKFFENPNNKDNRVVTAKGSIKEYKNYEGFSLALQSAIAFLKLQPGFIVLLSSFYENFVNNIFVRRMFFTDEGLKSNDLGKYIHSLLLNRGIFIGTEPVKFFCKLIEDYLIPKIDNIIYKPLFIDYINSKPDSEFPAWMAAQRAKDTEYKRFIANIYTKETLIAAIEIIYNNYIYKEKGIHIRDVLLAYLSPQEFSQLVIKKNTSFTLNYSDHVDPVNMTFMDLFRMTKTNLVISGSNVTKHIPRLFSVDHTPNMPVAQAVALSMSIPLAFKPVYIGKPVKGTQIDTYNRRYLGLYVDGGLLNNFPIHVFNGNLIPLSITQFGVETTYQVADSKREINDRSEFKKSTLGFRLTDLENLKDKEIDIYGDGKQDGGNNLGIFGDYMGDLFSTIRYDSTLGQLTTAARVNSIPLKTTGISLFDFSSPELDKQRKTKLPDQTDPSFIKQGEVITMAEYKTKLINDAYEVTKKNISTE